MTATHNSDFLRFHVLTTASMKMYSGMSRRIVEQRTYKVTDKRTEFLLEAKPDERRGKQRMNEWIDKPINKSNKLLIYL
jgi:hypothetical protein